MRLFRKTVLVLLALALVSAAPAAEKKDKKKKKDKPPESEKAAAEKKKKGEPETKPAVGPGQDKGKLSLPLVEGHDSKGLKIPSYDTQGNLQMVFSIGVATKLDADRVRMADTQVETYAADGSPEMSIELPVSVLNLSTRVITSDTKTTINRDDFTITGDSVEFDTLTKAGKLVGNVHMTIYQLSDEVSSPEAPTPPEKTTNE